MKKKERDNEDGDEGIESVNHRKPICFGSSTTCSRKWKRKIHESDRLQNKSHTKVNQFHSFHVCTFVVQYNGKFHKLRQTNVKIEIKKFSSCAGYQGVNISLIQEERSRKGWIREISDIEKPCCEVIYGLEKEICAWKQFSNKKTMKINVRRDMRNEIRGRDSSRNSSINRRFWKSSHENHAK